MHVTTTHRGVCQPIVIVVVRLYVSAACGKSTQTDHQYISFACVRVYISRAHLHQPANQTQNTTPDMYMG